MIIPIMARALRRHLHIILEAIITPVVLTTQVGQVIIVNTE